VSKGAFQHYIEVQGNVETDQNVLVNPEFSGVITSVRVEEGQRVSAGQVIATIDAKTLRKNMDELKTRLELAEDVYQRQKKLWDQKIGTEMQYLQAKNNKESLEKSLETLKSQLGQASVKAPISGVVEQLMANKGETANPAMPIARIVNTSKMEVVADVSEAHLKSVKRGDVVTVDFPVLEESLEAKIDVVGAFIDPKNRTFKVQVKIPNTAGYLKPNVTAVVKIKDFDKDDAVFIPTNLIQQSATGDQYVLLLENKGGKQTVTKRIVKAGIAYKGQSVIEEGLSGGEQIITKGYTEVVPGEEVQRVKNEF
jgi:RND family efflux transporter MFP subunit